jgi:hypothetical protein
VRDIRRRIALMYAGSVHLRRPLPLDNPHNSIPTLYDLGQFTGTMPSLILSWRLESPPKHCRFDCRDIKHCPKRPACRNIQLYQQQRLSDFFRGWDAGTIVKARVGDQWLLVHRNPSLAQMAAAQGSASQTRSIQGKVEISEMGVRLKL